jgi:hypothetical protein
MTNKDYGSEFLTTPKTLGIVVYCPVPLDIEIGADSYYSMMLIICVQRSIYLIK